MMNGWDGMGGTGWVLMTLVWLVVLGVIVWSVANLFPTRGSSSGSADLDRPEDVLDRRLARGEIDPATYDELRAKLRAARAERV